jgi:hypothetical protein
MPSDQEMKGDIRTVNVRKPTWDIGGNTYGRVGRRSNRGGGSGLFDGQFAGLKTVALAGEPRSQAGMLSAEA